MPCYVTYELDGRPVGTPMQPVSTPFVRAAINVTGWDLLRGLLRGRMRLVVSIVADDETVTAFDEAVAAAKNRDR